jgi:hypothetical protein
MPDPIRKIEIGSVLIAALGREIEQHVGGHHFLGSAPEGGIGVEDIAVVILQEHAEAGQIFERNLALLVIVISLALGDLFLGE